MRRLKKIAGKLSVLKTASNRAPAARSSVQCCRAML